MGIFNKTDKFMNIDISEYKRIINKKFKVVDVKLHSNNNNDI